MGLKILASFEHEFHPKVQSAAAMPMLSAPARIEAFSAEFIGAPCQRAGAGNLPAGVWDQYEVTLDPRPP